MRKLFPFFILLSLSYSLGAAEPLREDININRDWKFQLGDYPGAYRDRSSAPTAAGKV